MSTGDTARANYQSVRAEIQERIQLRDNVLVFYLGAVGTILGVALGTQATVEILLIIPYLALGASTIVSHHHTMIGLLGDFLARKLGPFLKEIGEDAPQWDTSYALRSNPNRLSWMGRRAGHLLLIDFPAIAALVMNWKHSIYQPLPEFLLWWSGIALTIFSVLIIWESSRARRRLYQLLNDELDRNAKGSQTAKHE